MNPSAIVADVASVLALVKEFPDVVAAVESVFTHAKNGEDTTPALKHLEAVAAARVLDIPYS